MAKITYDNKVALNPQPGIANINKCTADDLNEIKQVVNENDDILNNIGTQKQAFGDIFTSDGTYTATLYSNLVATYIGNGIWKIDYTGRISDNSSSGSYFDYGLSISKISTLLDLDLECVVSSGIDYKSNYYLYNTSGELDMVKVGYGTVFEYKSAINALLPTRIYTATGSVGGWPLSTFSNDYLLTGTLYLKEQ